MMKLHPFLSFMMFFSAALLSAGCGSETSAVNAETPDEILPGITETELSSDSDFIAKKDRDSSSPDNEYVDADAGEDEPLDEGDDAQNSDEDRPSMLDDEISAVDSDNIPAFTDFSQKGAYTVTTEEEKFSDASCNMDYFYSAPAQKDTSLPIIMLSHGLMRSKRNMKELGEHLASYGFEVVVPTSCSLTDHLKIADDLFAFAKFWDRPVIFAGHSAGGLRSLLAAVKYDKTVAVFGLDLVDTGEEGKTPWALDAAPDLGFPLRGIAGMSQDCNAENNGFPVYSSAPDSVLFQAAEANHCNFEFPTDISCTSFCGNDKSHFSDEQVSTVVKTMITAYIVNLTGVDRYGDEYWREDGIERKKLEENGALIPIK